jgi:protein-arginine kinase activator protein McsA
MREEKTKPKKCAKCGKSFLPTQERKLTCENCYRLNSHISPYAEEPDQETRRKRTEDFSVFHFLRTNPVRVSEDK